MDLLKKIKIELWVFFLILLLFFIFIIGFGSLVRHEILAQGSGSRLPFLTKNALFLAEIPSNLSKLISGQSNALQSKEHRFENISGFIGSPMDKETYLLLSRYDGDEERSIVELVDLRSFDIKKIWRPDIKKINKLVNKSIPEFKNLNRDHNFKRFRIIHPFLTEDGGLIIKDVSPLTKINKNSEVVWQNQEDLFHHSIEEDHEANFWIPSRVFPNQINNKYVESDDDNYLDDAITKISPNGKILFQKSVSNILIENNLGYLLFPIIGQYTQDPIHLNDIQPVLNDGPFWKQGDVFLSLRSLSMILLYRPSTNQIIWKSSGHTVQQHDIDILDDHRISVYDNNRKLFGSDEVNGYNEITIYDFRTDSYSNYFVEPIEKLDVRTSDQGLSQIFDSGELFIEETRFGRLLFFNKDSSIKWQYVNRADDENIYMLNWSRIFYKQNDLEKVRKILDIQN